MTNTICSCYVLTFSSIVKPPFSSCTETCPTLPSRRVPLLSFSVSGRPGIRTVEILTHLQVLWRRLERSTVKVCLRVQMRKKQTLHFEGLLKTTCIPPGAVCQHLQFRVQVDPAKVSSLREVLERRWPIRQFHVSVHVQSCTCGSWHEFGTDSKCFSLSKHQSAKPSHFTWNSALAFPGCIWFFFIFFFY